VRVRFAWVAALALIALLTALPAGALAATCPRTSVADVEDEVMCPVCKTPLALAQEAPQADRERVFILQQIERCRSKQAIKVALAAEFGDEVLAAPEGEGFDLAAYLVPAVALALALGGCAVAVARWRGGRGPPAAGGSGGAATAGSARAPGAAPEASARLDRDLERYDF
jgi:cytochrome c-type biogenesis protein CcmH